MFLSPTILFNFEKLGETYMPYNDFGSPHITNEKEFTITKANNETMYITPEKNIVSNTIFSNYIYLIQQKYECDGDEPSGLSDSQQNYQHDGQCVGNMLVERSPLQQNYQSDGQYLANMRSLRDCSNGNAPSDPSDHEFDDINFDNKIQISPYEREITDKLL